MLCSNWGFLASSSTDKAFCSLTDQSHEKQLTEQDLSIADANGILAQLASMPGASNLPESAQSEHHLDDAHACAV